MTNEELASNLECIAGMIEWDYPINYSGDLIEAANRLRNQRGDSMSYDLRILVKVEGLDYYAQVDEPYNHANPTYNLGKMFRECMEWDFDQGEVYKCIDVLPKLHRGLENLISRPAKYKQYEPPNGWGTIQSAVDTLMSLINCINSNTDRIPIEHLYMSW